MSKNLELKKVVVSEISENADKLAAALIKTDLGQIYSLLKPYFIININDFMAVILFLVTIRCVKIIRGH